MKHAKLAKDHILKSLNIIYQRAMTELQNYDFPVEFDHLLYNQFYKSEEIAEEKLTIFLATCIRHSENRRVSLFLRLANLGECINKKSYSRHAFNIYLTSLDYIKQSDIGKIPPNPESSQMVLYPTLRCISCLRSLIAEFSNEENIQKIEILIKQSSIPDPKSINLEGLVDLEFVLNLIIDEYESISWEIFNIVNFLHQTITIKDDRFYLTKEEVKALIMHINPDKFQLISDESEDTQILKNLVTRYMKDEVISLDKFIDMCIECLMLTEDSINKYIEEFGTVEDEKVEKYILNDYSSISQTVQEDNSIWADMILKHIENYRGFNPKASLVWWKIIKSEYLKYL